jgi:hypothetical protein
MRWRELFADFAHLRSLRLLKRSIAWGRWSQRLRGISDAEINAEISADEDAGVKR